MNDKDWDGMVDYFDFMISLNRTIKEREQAWQDFKKKYLDEVGNEKLRNS